MYVIHSLQCTRSILIACIVLVLLSCTPAADVAAQSNNAAPGEIIQIQGKLYEARTGIHNTVFLVTSEGIILADPLSADFSAWLKTELTRRFGSTVEYVIYSHHHPDHADGGKAFADTATFVGHDNMAIALEAPLPSNAVELDSNGNGTLERSEAIGLGYDGSFDRYDRNDDDRITSAEIYADTPAPDLTYSTQMTINLGDSSVELIHPGPAHSDDMTVLSFPEQRALFGVDFVHVKRFPITLGGYPVDRYVEAIARLEDLNFDILIPGHGDVGDKTDLILFLDFLRALEAAVADGITAGKSLEEIHATVVFPEYESWLLYESRRIQLITEAYQLLTEP